jgi:hypothetical protein
LIYQKKYDELLEICQQIVRHRQKIAKPRIIENVLKNVDVNISNEDMLSHLVAESLLKRIDRQLLESKNIYIQQFDIPQIVMFYSMAEAIPFVFAGHYLANQYLRKTIGNLKVVTLLDIGIGKGLQAQKLLKMLGIDNNNLEIINIIGVDPGEQNLIDSKNAFEQIKRILPFTVNYYPVCNLLENFTDNDYDFIKEIGGKNILINSSFTFHHMSHPFKDYESRTLLFNKLAKLEPLVITLIEPNSNHDIEELSKRFHHSWQHFGNVFKLIDESNIDISHKFSIKEKFFGREIRDIFGVSDYFRCERHELFESWLLRLTKAGFKPFEFKDLTADLPYYCEYSVSEGLVRLNYNDITIVAVFAYTL